MNTDLIRLQLINKLRNKNYRDSFVSAHIGTNIASQIFAIRNRRRWTQTELADKAGMAQTRISVLEDANYENFSIMTLKRLASAFDVALIVRFVPFGELAEWVVNLSPSSLAVPSFAEEQERSFSISEAASRGPIREELESVLASGIPIGTGIFRETYKEVALGGYHELPTERIPDPLTASPRQRQRVVAGQSQ